MLTPWTYCLSATNCGLLVFFIIFFSFFEASGVCSVCLDYCLSATNCGLLPIVLVSRSHARHSTAASARGGKAKGRANDAFPVLFHKTQNAIICTCSWYIYVTPMWYVVEYIGKALFCVWVTGGVTKAQDNRQ